MALEDLFSKLQLLNLKDVLNSQLGENITEHAFIDDIGFNRIVLMWDIVKPTHTINLAYEFYNGVLTFKTQLKIINTKCVITNNFYFTGTELKNINTIARFSANTVRWCITKGILEFKKTIAELNKAQKRMKKNGK